MNFLHLKYLIEVEKYESISKAAQHLYINQPRLSKIIKEIEEELQVELFIRGKKALEPTIEAEFLKNHAIKILEEYENYFQEVKTYISDVKTAQSLTLSHIYQKNETLTEKEKLIKFKHLRKEL